MYEVRIHSRGGQGGVTAARLLAHAAFLDGKHASACPFYGAERRGAPVVSFVRIDDKPIRVYSQIRHPDLVVVLDTTIMDAVDVLQGLKPDGVVFLNSSEKSDAGEHTTYTVDLTAIALSLGLVIAGSPILNTPVLGALARMGVVSFASVKAAIAVTFSDKRNVRAAEAAYQELVL
ncbi:MAG: 2-oxoacid:acceptor oxidoreductase family protein [Methanomicrobiales archaeon]|nr:2-oxoacid:acceptor oxidoreductase family protein [Methanomicrobiales archaeon]